MMLTSQSPIQVAKKVLLGTMLGDGCMVSISDLKAYFVVNHGIDQLPYLIWKMEILNPSVGTFAVNMYNRKGKKGEWSIRSKVSAWTLSSTYLRHIYNDFYFNRNSVIKKEVHLNVLRRLTPESLAVWYMDDGSLGKSKYGKEAYMTLATCAYTEQECEMIIQYMSDTWGVLYYITKHVSGLPYLYADVKSTRRFFEIVTPYMCPTMLYKVDASLSAGRLSDEEGDDMIRTLQECKELVRDYQPIVKECLTDIVRKEIGEYLSSHAYNWATEYQYNSGKPTYRFYMYDGSPILFEKMKLYFGGYIQVMSKYKWKYSNGRKSAQEMLDITCSE